MEKNIGDNTHLKTSSTLHTVNKSVTGIKYRAVSARLLQFLLIITITLLSVVHSKPCSAAADPIDIRVGSELEFPPYAFVDENGRAAGFSVDLIKAVTSAMGLSIKISTGTWDSVWGDLVAGRLDILPIVAKLPERTHLVDFSLPHTETYDAFFVREGSNSIRDIREVGEKEIAVMRSDAAHHALQERDFQGHLVLVDTIPEGLSLIASGKHDAFLCPKLIGTLAIRTHGIKGLYASPPIPDYKRVFSFAVKKSDTELLEKLNQGLLIVKANGEYQRIYDKWLAIDDPWQKYRKYLMPFIWGVTAFALFGVFWLVMLQRLVRKRTSELTERNEMLTQIRDGLDKTVAERTAELSSLNAALLAEIAERKRTEDILRESEERYRMLYTGTPVMMHSIDRDGRLVSVSDYWLNTIGYSREEVIGRRSTEFLTEASRRYAQEVVLPDFVKTGICKDIEYQFVKKNGDVIDTQLSAIAERDSSGQFLRSLAVIINVTERKQAEESLRFSEEKFRALAEQSITGTCIIQDGKFIYVNPHLGEILDFRQDEMIGLQVLDLVAERDRDMVRENIHKRISGEISFMRYIFNALKKDGSEVPLEVYGSAMIYNGRPAIMATLLDITERNQVEKALKSLAISFAHLSGKEFFEAISRHIAESLDLDFAFIGHLNDPANTVSVLGGYAMGNAMGELTYALEDTPCYNVIGKRICVYPSGVISQFPKDLLLAQMKIEGYIGAPLFDKQQRPIGILVALNTSPLSKIESITRLFNIFMDQISAEMQRIKAQAALETSEERLRLAVNGGSVGIWQWDVATNQLDWNDQLKAIFGLPASTTGLTLEKFMSAIYPDDLADIEHSFRTALENHTEFKREYRIIWPDGRMHWIIAIGRGIYDPENRPLRMLGCALDITERKQAEHEKEKLQAQLLQAQKMEAVGHLAGGVAHDFNNALTAIIGFAYILKNRLKEDGQLAQNAEQIISVSNRAALTVSSLLAFSRKQVMQMKSVNINNIVSGIIKILDRIIGEDINLQVNTAVHDLIVNIDINQIEQVIVNLATNARDAMPGGGTITIATEEFEMDDKYIRIHHFGKTGKYAVLSVTDTGMGMDEKTRENIFDPFFTTKEVGKGTGLGLAMIYGTIKQHNGFINVYSEPEKGTTFKIYLPLAESTVNVIEEKGAGSVPSGTETVLLAEDDEKVRYVTRILLEEYGYSVIEAIDGKQAVELFRENRNRVHLVITDVIMPGQSGKDLHKELMKIAPGIKIIFISGYPADMLAKKGIIDSEVNFISKPVKPEILLQKIRGVLEK